MNHDWSKFPTEEGLRIRARENLIRSRLTPEELAWFDEALRRPTEQGIDLTSEELAEYDEAVRRLEKRAEVRTVEDAVQDERLRAYFIAYGDLGLDPRKDIWIRREGAVDSLPGLKKRICFAKGQRWGVRLATSQTLNLDKMQPLADPVDEAAWIVVRGTF